MKRILITAAVLLLNACDYIPLSGGELTGTPTPAPASWTDAAAASVIQLETNPSEPYSVKLWIVGSGKNLWVHAGDNRTTWVEHIEADPRVRLKISDALYELEAVRVDSKEEFAEFARLYEEKYGTQPRNLNIAEIYLFRLTSPSPKTLS